MDLGSTLYLIASILFFVAALLAFRRGMGPGGERNKQAGLVFLIVGALNLALFFGLIDLLFAE